MHKTCSIVVALAAESAPAAGLSELSTLGPTDVVVVFGPDGALVADRAHEVATRLGCRSAGYVTAGDAEEIAARLAVFCIEQFGSAPSEARAR